MISPDDILSQCRHLGCLKAIRIGEGYCKQHGGPARLKAESRRLAEAREAQTAPIVPAAQNQRKFKKTKRQFQAPVAPAAPRPKTAADIKIVRRDQGPRRETWGRNGAPVGTGLSRFMRR